MGQKKKRVIILGSTGTIGINTLDVINSSPDIFEVSAISCFNSVDIALKQAEKTGCKNICIVNPLKKISNFNGNVFYDEKGLDAMIRRIDADIVVNGIAGARGLIPSIAALESGKNLALANKETIVMAGGIVLPLAVKNGLKILPVDSEHSAIFYLLENKNRDHIKEIILTASGGAFRDLPVGALKDVTLEQALLHPNWKMGKKITIDSATMANKGLEVIEAKFLFNFDISKIKVLIHPQSIVHSLVKTNEGSLYAQLSKPDMRIPIQNALSYPAIINHSFQDWDLTSCPLTFHAVNLEKYPMLALAYNAANGDWALPVVYNASNEEAVDAFLKGMIRFLEIPEITEAVLSYDWKHDAYSLPGILFIDQKARTRAQEILGKRNSHGTK